MNLEREKEKGREEEEENNAKREAWESQMEDKQQKRDDEYKL